MNVRVLPARQRLDRSACSVVAICTCGWRDLAFTELAAWELAAEHGSRVHGNSEYARDAIRAIHKRRKAA